MHPSIWKSVDNEGIRVLFKRSCTCKLDKPRRTTFMHIIDMINNGVPMCPNCDTEYNFNGMITRIK